MCVRDEKPRFSPSFQKMVRCGKGDFFRTYLHSHNARRNLFGHLISSRHSMFLKHGMSLARKISISMARGHICSVAKAELRGLCVTFAPAFTTTMMSEFFSCYTGSNSIVAHILRSFVSRLHNLCPIVSETSLLFRIIIFCPYLNFQIKTS